MVSKPKYEIGTVRFKRNLQPYVRTRHSWKKCQQKFSGAEAVIRLFRANHRLGLLIDNKDSRWLKGFLTKDNEPRGARIKFLPDGKELDKAFSLFAENLKIHDQDSGDHWDVIFQNNGGTFAYCYTLEKKKGHARQKYKKVWQFDKVYQRLLKRVEQALRDENDYLAVPVYTLLKIYMRVGNEIYYKAHGHKGLTTLKNKDIRIKDNIVQFNYLGKDGVPIAIEQKFSKDYLQRLQRLLKQTKPSDFIFTAPGSKHPLSEQHFKKAFKGYVGIEFYPHIVRSYYASKQVRDFLRSNKKVSKQEVDGLFLRIAHQLGHQKFVKKKQQWEDNATVTVSHYVQPELVEKVRARMV